MDLGMTAKTVKHPEQYRPKILRYDLKSMILKNIDKLHVIKILKFCSLKDTVKKI